MRCTLERCGCNARCAPWLYIYTEQRDLAAAVFVAGALVSIGGFMLLSGLKDLHPTSTILWAVMLAYSLGMPWILGRLLSRIVRRDGVGGEEPGTSVN